MVYPYTASTRVREEEDSEAAGDPHGVGCSEHSNGCEGGGRAPCGTTWTKGSSSNCYEGLPYWFQARPEGVQMSGSQHEISRGEP